MWIPIRVILKLLPEPSSPQWATEGNCDGEHENKCISVTFY